MDRNETKKPISNFVDARTPEERAEQGKVGYTLTTASTHFDLSDAKKKRIIKKAARDGAEMQREIMEQETKIPILCFVEGDTAYFTTQGLSEQWGDDWDDAPYEHNAGLPYKPSGDEKWEIHTLKFSWDCDLPHDGLYNSPWSVQEINKKRVPWLKPSKWVKNGHNIYAGTTISEFCRMIMTTGGLIYRQLNEGDIMYFPVDQGTKKPIPMSITMEQRDNAIRKQAITEVIEALEMKKESVVLAGEWSQDKNGNPIAGTLRYDSKRLAEGIGFNRAVVLLDEKIAALKEREGL